MPIKRRDILKQTIDNIRDLDSKNDGSKFDLKSIKSTKDRELYKEISKIKLNSRTQAVDIKSMLSRNRKVSVERSQSTRPKSSMLSRQNLDSLSGLVRPS